MIEKTLTMSFFFALRKKEKKALSHILTQGTKSFTIVVVVGFISKYFTIIVAL
jgi:hypothetical protein